MTNALTSWPVPGPGCAVVCNDRAPVRLQGRDAAGWDATLGAADARRRAAGVSLLWVVGAITIGVGANPLGTADDPAVSWGSRSASRFVASALQAAGPSSVASSGSVAGAGNGGAGDPGPAGAGPGPLGGSSDEDSDKQDTTAAPPAEAGSAAPDASANPATLPEPAAGLPQDSSPPASAPLEQPATAMDVPVAAPADAAATGHAAPPATRAAACPTPHPTPSRARHHARKPQGAVATLSAGTAPAVPAPAASDDRVSSTAHRCAHKKRAAKHSVSPERPARHTDGSPDRVPRADQGVPTIPAVPTTPPLDPVPVGIPNFFIDNFRIPPFLLPIYQAAGMQYGVRWEVLAAINGIETDYGRNLNISSAGAVGWMQFMPDSWRIFGTDANSDGRSDPLNPVDAIFAAARYLKAAGADRDLRAAIHAYNHADWYVESVLTRTRLIAGLPTDLVGSLSGLTQGVLPVFGRARYAADVGTTEVPPGRSDGSPSGIDIFARAGAPAIAVQDGTITAVGASQRLGRYVKLLDVYGNTYTYAHLKKVAARVPVPKTRTQSSTSMAVELALPRRDKRPTRAASAGHETSGLQARAALDTTSALSVAEAPTRAGKERLFAHPARRRALANGGSTQIFESGAAIGDGHPLRWYLTGAHGLRREDVVLKALVVGRRVTTGTILGRIGQTGDRIAPRLHFEIRPAGRDAPRIDPEPILDGWKLLRSTALYQAQARNPLTGGADAHASIGQIMLMTKEALARAVLTNPDIRIYSCGRHDIQVGAVDRRVLATLQFLAASGLRPTVTSLSCEHSVHTRRANIAHASGNAVDIAKINDVPVLGHQGHGSITDTTVRRLLTLQGTMKPQQIISLMSYQGTDNTLARRDHADHIHIGFLPTSQPGSAGAHELGATLKPKQWLKLIYHLDHIDNPTVNLNPSRYAIRAIPSPSRSRRAPHT